ncbi:GM26596 [Drosophila sechellia]|uniref:GM26596 n=1 Tax=Drosophila sechellia TaxID=7238 RepID=B4HH15_DROSE|nr:GM26596 [Drosophila sechellia]
MNIEQACYYPVPSKREDVYPKRYRQRTTTTEKPKTTTEPTYVWIPGTNWRFKATPLKKPMPMKLHQRIDVRPQKPSYVDPAKWAHWSKYGNRYENWSPANHNYEKYRQPGRWSKWTTQSPKWSKRWYRSADGEYYDPEDMRHYNGHRDRRQLFEHFDGFSKLLGIDAKACVLRAICDSKRLLLPRGYSMIQDIVRLVFTLPTASGVEDDYSRIMQMDADGCDRQFRDSCKLNLLAWLMGGKWN